MTQSSSKTRNLLARLSWKWLIAVLVMVALVAVALQPKEVTVEAGTVIRGDLEVTVAEDGRTRVKQRYTLVAPVSGNLLRVDLKAGDTVKADRDRVFAVKPQPPALLNQRDRAEREARVAVAQARLAEAKAQIDKVKAALALAERQAGRQKDLADKGFAGKEAFDQARTELLLRRAELRVAQDGVDVAASDVRLAEAGLLLGEGDAGTLEALEVIAPINGQVFRVFRESEGWINQGEPVLELGDSRQLEVVVDLLSKDAVQIQPGAAVKLKHWGGETVLQGTVRLIEPSGFTKVSALGVEEQRVNVIVDILSAPAEWEHLRDGFRVEVDITTWQAKNLVLTPASSLFWADDQWWVYRLQQDRLEKVAVEVGRRNTRFAEVKQGLTAEDRVVLFPGDEVKAGVKVKTM
ncbi:efflux RND transporter periplasmic adaptor subunit [Acanthopleuribacter pedis]|uniref:HlyD family efflux transporter periplasmic adaptor subunit n=1 Tax=Acanthopleuribacter pedis TaxID=442870 RepID=A0A8J7QAB5_9BACT|nr:HlyD family efflux transporter periplasmic adaptor subunit [Acanthopleuribacter pedis]MBO1319954.1 HlyD family efflux transporter periplasmic adaptor subunit [Acanthopleuribacter pedis]